MSLIPTYGFRGNEAKLFHLRPGEQLPPGWSDHPGAAGEPEPSDERQGTAQQGGGLTDTELEEIKQGFERLAAENEALRRENDKLRADNATLRARISELEQTRAGEDREPDISELRVRAEELGIQVNPRWGIAKLQRLIEEAENDSNKPHGE